MENPFSSIAIFIIINSGTQRNTINGNKIQERLCADLSVLTVIKIVHRPSPIVHRPGFSTCPLFKAFGELRF